jgi:hypothetical protein
MIRKLKKGAITSDLYSDALRSSDNQFEPMFRNGRQLENFITFISGVIKMRNKLRDENSYEAEKQLRLANSILTTFGGRLSLEGLLPVVGMMEPLGEVPPGMRETLRYEKHRLQKDRTREGVESYWGMRRSLKGRH